MSAQSHLLNKLLSFLIRHQFQCIPTLQIHAQLLTTGSFLHNNAGHRTSLMIFNTLLRHYSLGCHPQHAIHLYNCSSLQLSTDSFTFSFLLKACANMLCAQGGIQFHGLTKKNGWESNNVYVQTALVNMYSECGYLPEALKVFKEMTVRNSVTWNAMITGLTKWGDVDSARWVFDKMPSPNVVSWTGMVDGFTRAGKPEMGLDFFRKMFVYTFRPTEVTVLAVIPAISNLRDLDVADSVHGYSRKVGIDSVDVRIPNSLIDMYARCGSIPKSLQLFREIEQDNRANIVSWTSIISAYAMHGLSKQAVDLFRKLEKEHEKRGNIKPNGITILSVLNACSHGGLVEEGLEIFSSTLDKYGVQLETKHHGCIVDMLGRAGRLEEAEKVILGMNVDGVNVVLWRTLMGCCNVHGDVEMGERVMKKIMELEKGYGGDYVILSNVLTSVGRFRDAQRIREHIDDRQLLKIPGRSSVAVSLL